MNSQQLRYVLMKYVELPTIVCASDQLRTISSKTFAVICNNQPSTEGGMHWISFLKTGSSLEFFDSFGLPVEFYGSMFTDFIRNHGGKVKQSFTQFQSNSSDLCGGYSLYFLINRDRGLTYNDVIKSFSNNNTKVNDKKINLFVKENVILPKFSSCGQICSGKCLKDLSSVCIQKNKRCIRLVNKLSLE
jgi:hypothetical protein